VFFLFVRHISVNNPCISFGRCHFYCIYIFMAETLLLWRIYSRHRWVTDRWAHSNACAASQYCGSSYITQKGVAITWYPAWRNAIQRMCKWLHPTVRQVFITRCWVMMTWYETQQYKMCRKRCFQRVRSERSEAISVDRPNENLVVSPRRVLYSKTD
jgi:predicted phosphoadenosine phosphosulfate sulfurtransferase